MCATSPRSHAAINLDCLHLVSAVNQSCILSGALIQPFYVCSAGFTPLIWYVIHVNGPTAELEKALWDHSSSSTQMSRKSVFFLDRNSHDCSFFHPSLSWFEKERERRTPHRFYGECNSSEQMLLKQVKVSARTFWPHVSRRQREKNKRGMQRWRCAPGWRSGVPWNLFIAVGFIPLLWLCAAAALSLFSTWADQLWSTSTRSSIPASMFHLTGELAGFNKIQERHMWRFQTSKSSSHMKQMEKKLAAWLSSIILKWFHKCYPGMKLYIFFLKKIPETLFST